MKIQYCRNYQDLSNSAATLIWDILKKQNHSVMALAAGASPVGVYKKLSLYLKNKKINLKCVQLDEYIGAAVNCEDSFFYFLDKHFLYPNNIDLDTFLYFNGKTVDPIMECKKYFNKLNEWGDIDIAILGIGTNGHIAFNEPGSFINDTVRVVDLAETSMDKNKKYFKAMTIGIKEIMEAKKIILLVTGQNKKKIFMEFIKQNSNSKLPASFIKTHPDIIVFVDQSIL